MHYKEWVLIAADLVYQLFWTNSCNIIFSIVIPLLSFTSFLNIRWHVSSTFVTLWWCSIFIYLMIRNVICVFNRTPLLTIKTNAYHFCKLSIAKSPSETLETDDLEINKIVDDIQRGEQGDPLTDSTISKGLVLAFSSLFSSSLLIKLSPLLLKFELCEFECALT